MGQKPHYTTEQLNFIEPYLKTDKPSREIANICIKNKLFVGRDIQPLTLKINRLREKQGINNTNKAHKTSTVFNKDIDIYKNLDVLLTAIMEHKDSSAECEALYKYYKNNLDKLKFNTSTDFCQYYKNYRDSKKWQEQAVVDEINNNSTSIYKTVYLTTSDINAMKTSSKRMKLKDFIVICETIKVNIYHCINEDDFRGLIMSIKLRSKETRDFIHTYGLNIQYEKLFPIEGSFNIAINHTTFNKNVITKEEVEQEIKKFYHFDTFYDMSEWEDVINSYITNKQPEVKTYKSLKELPAAPEITEPVLDRNLFTEFANAMSSNELATNLSNIYNNYKTLNNIEDKWNKTMRDEMINIILSTHSDLIEKKENKYTVDGKPYINTYFVLKTEPIFNDVVDDFIIEQIKSLKFNTINEALACKAGLLTVISKYYKQG